eukprot:1158536-Pelagomonas_calceolata.AAC.2
MADDEARRKALDLEARVLQGLKSMENSLSLVQHKVGDARHSPQRAWNGVGTKWLTYNAIA